MIKKIALAASIFGALSVTSIALAQATTTTPTAVPTTASQQTVLDVNPTGKVLMRGTIASIASGVITVNGWGGAWTVNVPSTAEVLPVEVGNDISQFKAGDFVGIQGTVSQNSNWTINATIVRDWTYRAEVVQQQKQNIQAARATEQSSTPRNFVGVASNVSGNTFTLTVGATAYTVNIASGAEIANRNWVTLPATSIVNGDNVRVWGINTSGTINAQIVRDVSIPAPTTTTR